MYFLFLAASDFFFNQHHITCYKWGCERSGFSGWQYTAYCWGYGQYLTQDGWKLWDCRFTEKGNINLYQAWLESFWSDVLPDIIKIIISLKNIRIYLDKSGYFDKIHVSAIKYRYLTVDAQYTTGGRLGFRLCLV